MENNLISATYPRVILGLDVSTACIGTCIVKDDGISEYPEIIELTHKSPKVSKKIKGIEALFLRKNIFEEEFIKPLAISGITDVVIEEPLLSSNNSYTVSTLLRFNGMVAECIYRHLGVVPNFISSYDARAYSFPDLMAIRKYNKKGEPYPIKHIQKALKNGDIVLFGEYPYDIDKKTVMMNKVSEAYPDIEWVTNAKGELIKENYDACDSLVCALAYINVNRYGLEHPVVIDSHEGESDGKGNIVIRYTTSIWGKNFDKQLILQP